jgi:Na+/melibiose symporter-like transporter
MADVDDYGEWKTGKRITGISFSGNPTISVACGSIQ